MLNHIRFGFAPQINNGLFSENLFEQADKNKLANKNGNRKILVHIISTDRDTRYLLRTILEIWGYEVAESEDAEQLERSAERKRPDAVVMDTKLMIGKSFEEMIRLKKNLMLADTPFILLSGHAQTEYRTTALAAGAAEWLVKPLDLDRLEVTIKTKCRPRI